MPRGGAARADRAALQVPAGAQGDDVPAAAPAAAQRARQLREGAPRDAAALALRSGACRFASVDEPVAQLQLVRTGWVIKLSVTKIQ